MKQLLSSIQQCSICIEHLDHGVNPIVSISASSKIAIIGQAPGSKVHATGIPWDDPSGKKLRTWLNVSDEEFYDNTNFALVPMGFCYPGKGKSGDLPPRPECAPKWHSQLFNKANKIQLIILIGQYAQNYYLENREKNLTETVKNFKNYLPAYIPLPHPSPRNNSWLKKNQWFETNVIPTLQERVKNIL